MSWSLGEEAHRRVAVFNTMEARLPPLSYSDFFQKSGFELANNTYCVVSHMSQVLEQACHRPPATTASHIVLQCMHPAAVPRPGSQKDVTMIWLLYFSQASPCNHNARCTDTHGHERAQNVGFASNSVMIHHSHPVVAANPALAFMCRAPNDYR